MLLNIFESGANVAKTSGHEPVGTIISSEIYDQALFDLKAALVKSHKYKVL